MNHSHHPYLDAEDLALLGDTTRDEEVCLRLSFLDRAGRVHYAVHRTTLDAEEVKARAGEIRLAMNTCYAMLGCELLSVQAHFERTELMEGQRSQPRLRLLEGGGVGPERRSGKDRRRDGWRLALVGLLGSLILGSGVCTACPQAWAEQEARLKALPPHEAVFG